ncbi:hypothetical protein RYH80_01555 [Halobaculum sp. MBLA0147]|uniref:hypothetical protein n=1 Tax=Halobaculum sp. MBLA0147 TaxID=3079934 RepID=UPI003525C658
MTDRSGLPSGTWRPPRTVTALSLVALVAAVWPLAGSVGVRNTAVVTGVGGLATGLLVRLAGADRVRPLALAGATVALFPAGATVTAGTALVFASQFAGTAPVGAVFLVGAVGLAVFGATGLPGAPVGSDAVLSAGRVGLAVGVGTVAAAAVPTATRVTEREAGVELPTVDLATPVATTLSPDPLGAPAVGSFLTLVGFGAVAFGQTLRTLPVRELLDDRTDDTETAVATLNRVLRVSEWGLFPGVLGVLLWIVTVFAPDVIPWNTLPAWLFEVVRGVAASSTLRTLSLGLVGAFLAVSVTVRVVRGAYRTRLGTRADWLGVVAGWLALLWLGWGRAPLVTGALEEGVLAALPASAATPFRTEWEAVLSYYGPQTVALGVVAVCVAVAATLLVALTGATVLGFLPETGVGHGLVAAGLFAAGGFGVAVDAGTLVSFGALVAAVAVWDLGSYGVELGREVGRVGRSRTATLSHLGGTLLISGAAAGSAVAVARATQRVPLSPGAPAPLALLAGVAALVVFAVLLRL